MSDTVANHTSMRIGAYSGSREGRLAIDNVFAYKGIYEADDDKLVFSESENISVDLQNSTIIYDEEFFPDMASLKSEIISITGASKADFFNDDFSEISENKITDNIVITSASGVSTYCFGIQPLSGIGTPEIVCDGDKVGARAVAFNNRAESRNLTMIMAIRDAQGCLEKVYSSQEYCFNGEQEFIIDPVDIGDGSAYVFFIENWETLRAASLFVTKIK